VLVVGVWWYHRGRVSFEDVRHIVVYFKRQESVWAVLWRDVEKG
jgi:hypothetical protein